MGEGSEGCYVARSKGERINVAHFRATIQGMRGMASRLGSKETGIRATINGWDSGIDVECFYDKTEETDIFVVTLTSGSGYNGRPSKELGRFTRADLEQKETEADEIVEAALPDRYQIKHNPSLYASEESA